MITVIINVVNFLANIIKWLFISASIVGEVIVKTVTIIFSSVLSSVENILLFFQIVYEDNVYIFTEDIPSSTGEFLDSMVKHCIQLHNYFSTVCYSMLNDFKVFISTFRWSFEELLMMVTEFILLWKKTLIFLGETSWLVLTFIPVQVPLLLLEVWKKFRDGLCCCALEAYTIVLRFTNFLTDVPLESFIGLLMAIVIVRLSLHFRNTLRTQTTALYWVLIRKVLYLYYTIHNYFYDYETRVISRMVGGQQLMTREDANAQIYEENGADSLCIICQEQPKCVLTLPCRHVCLCTDCCMRLYGYQRTCPICRTFIYQSVNVYL